MLKLTHDFKVKYEVTASRWFARTFGRDGNYLPRGSRRLVLYKAQRHGSNRPQLVSERKSPIFMKLKRAELHHYYYYYVNIDVTSWKHVHKLG